MNLVGLLVGSEEVGAIVTARLPFNQRLDLVGGLAAWKFKDDSEIRKEVLALLKKAREVQQERNRYIHSSWAIDADSKDPTYVRMKQNVKRQSGLETQFEMLTPDELNKVAENIRATVRMALDVIVKLLPDDRKSQV